MKLRTAALALLVTLAPSLAFADGDRQAARAKLKAAIVARFDADGDGKLSGPERREAKRALKRVRRAHRAMRKLARFDANGDGWVTDDELIQGRADR